jgi:hypothetical protein
VRSSVPMPIDWSEPPPPSARLMIPLDPAALYLEIAVWLRRIDFAADDTPGDRERVCRHGHPQMEERCGGGWADEECGPKAKDQANGEVSS